MTETATIRSEHWDGVPLGRYLDAAAASVPTHVAVVDGDVRLTYAELAAHVDRLASALQARGVGRGDVVSWQLPNWWEGVVTHHAILRLGAVSNPLMPILRERELTFSLAQARSRVLIVPERFRGFDFSLMADALAAELGHLEHVVVVRPGRPDGRSFETLLGESADVRSEEPDGNDVALLLYTSGTESVAKGVLHSHNTLGYEVRSIRDWFELTSSDVVFMPSPIAHITGVLYGLHLPSVLQSTVVLQDVWDARRALALIDRERCSFVVAATPFLHGLTYDDHLDRYDAGSLSVFACGGADVPPALVADATARLDCCVVRVYGSTELPTLTASSCADPLEKRAETDGRVIGASEARVRDDDGQLVGPGVVGHLEARGPDAFLGYLDASLTAAALTVDGWLRTGDLAAIDEDGYMTIRGRSKDIIVRGGENISSREVEDLLIEHPAVADVAIVGMPDAVLGERSCAFVVAAPGTEPTLDELVRHLEARRIARQKLPERLELVEQLPKTPSGKVQKFALRAEIAALMAEESASASGARP